MKQILQKIIDIDNEAKAKVNVQKERLDAINHEIAAEKSLIDERLKNDAQKIIGETEKESLEMYNSVTEKIDSHFNETSQKLKSAFDESHKKWVDEIYNNIIK